jgi:hypothetical protein
MVFCFLLELLALVRSFFVACIIAAICLKEVSTPLAAGC